MKLSEFVGYGDRLEQLMRSVQAGRIVHALLLSGPHGSGKRTLARLFAQAMLCKGIDKPCGVCPACKRFEAGMHPDVRTIVPEKKSISVETVRDLIDYLALKPYEGGKHIAIIEQAELMTPAAQNALLKTIEEPTGDVMFFLITDAPGALLPTIRSRCQTMRLSDLTAADCARVLVSRGIPPERADVLAGLAQGSVGRALELDGDAEFTALREKVIASLETLRDRASVSAAAAPLTDDKDRAGLVLEVMELWARDLMAVQAGAAPYEVADAARLERSGLDGRKLLIGVIKLRKQLQSNVAWQNALENMYFDLIDSGNNRRITLSWQR